VGERSKLQGDTWLKFFKENVHPLAKMLNRKVLVKKKKTLNSTQTAYL
jgi:hypothetical protein